MFQIVPDEFAHFHPSELVGQRSKQKQIAEQDTKHDFDGGELRKT